MNPESITSSLVTAHRCRCWRQRKPAARLRDRARDCGQVAARHRAQPRDNADPDVIASFHCFALNSNATYTFGSLTLISGRVAAVITSPFSFEHCEELNCGDPLS